MSRTVVCDVIMEWPAELKCSDEEADRGDDAVVSIQSRSPRSPRKAIDDRVILEDERVLTNLLEAEDRDTYPASPHNYFWFQKELLPYMRRIVVMWLLDVCKEQEREQDVFPLAVVFFDRVLTATQVTKSRLQLVATACLFIASKMKETTPLDGHVLVMYTDYSITIDELLKMELFVLTVLRWDTSAIIADDFIQLLLVRLPVIEEQDRRAVTRDSCNLISLCAIDQLLAAVSPSIIAASTLLVSIKDRVKHADIHVQLKRLASITRVDVEYISSCVRRIEHILSNSNGQQQQPTSELNSIHQQKHLLSSPSLTSTPVKNPTKLHQPPTPTDVREISLLT